MHLHLHSWAFFYAGSLADTRRALDLSRCRAVQALEFLLSSTPSRSSLVTRILPSPSCDCVQFCASVGVSLVTERLPSPLTREGFFAGVYF